MGNNTGQNSTYTVLAILEAKPSFEKELGGFLKNVVNPSRNEETCIDYRLHQNIENPAQFFLYENWSSQKAHEKQFEKDYIKELVEKVGPLLAKPYTIILAQELCGSMDHSFS
ncbi:MAG: antibiotic biosynthesis monooxygenase [bacterium]|nr:antibiotic biosynthesis monooxygenase [bacterium]